MGGKAMLYDLVKENRSYRGYKEGYTISEEDLKDLINMARITASGANLQPLKYRIVTDSSEVDALNSLTRWAKMLTNITLPHEGKYPNAYIVVCVDNDICKNEETAKMDIGIRFSLLKSLSSHMNQRQFLHHTVWRPPSSMK